MSTLLEMGLSNALMATVLALLAAVLASVCRRPALTHCLWLLVLLKLITPAIVPLPWSVLGGAAEDARKLSALVVDWSVDVELADTSGATPAGDAEPEQSPGDGGEPILSLQPPEAAVTGAGWLTGSWRESVGVLWLASSLVWFAWTSLHLWRFQRLLRHARPAPVELQARVYELAERLGLKWCPSVCLVPGTVSPMVWAIGGTPRLVLPAQLLERLDLQQQATLLVHELAHVCRRDHWVRLVELVVSGLYWWHPVVWWARRELHEAEEQCCDAWVIWALAGAGRTYALALLQTVAFVSQDRAPQPVLASGIGHVSHLRRRLTMILQGRTSRSLSWAGWLAVIGLGLFLLPLSPLQAEPAPQDKGRKGADQKDPRDEKIEILKKALQDLEAERRADKREGGPARRGEDAAAQKARSEVEQLAKQIADRRKELQSLEARLRDVRDRLADSQGPKAATRQEEVRRVIKIGKDSDSAPPAAAIGKEIGQIAQKMAQLKLEGKDQEFAQMKEKLEQLKLDMKDKVIAQVNQVKKKVEQELAQIKSKDLQPKLKPKVEVDLQAKPKPKVEVQLKDKKPADFEQKVDQLLKEVEDLRRELRREKR